MSDLPFMRTWLPVIYLYGVGGLIFLGGMIFIFRAKAINMKLSTDRRWFWILLFGFFYYAALHVTLTLAALYL